MYFDRVRNRNIVSKASRVYIGLETADKEDEFSRFDLLPHGRMAKTPDIDLE
jgi:hypothetical protein